MSDINFTANINEKDEIIDEKVEEIQDRMDQINIRMDQLQNQLKDKLDIIDDLDRKIKADKLTYDKLELKYNTQKDKSTKLLLMNKRIKNQFNQFMVKLGKKQQPKSGFMKKKTLDLQF